MVVNIVGMLRSHGDRRARCWLAAMGSGGLQRGEATGLRVPWKDGAAWRRRLGPPLVRGGPGDGAGVNHSARPVLDAEVDAAFAGRIEEHGFRQVERQLDRLAR